MNLALSATPATPGKPLPHYWSFCVGAGRANEGLRAGWLEHMKKAKAECGFKYVRFHGLFHDDMFVYLRDKDTGAETFNFQYIDDLFDRLLDIGIKPFVEFGFCPSALAAKTDTVFWWKANGAPPNDYAKWTELISRTVKHWLARYGAEEVRQWYFEVWNEPNLKPFFTGTKSQYFELYKVTAKAVKEADPLLRVGGPATSNYVPDKRFAGETEDESQHAVVTNAKDLDALDWQPVWLQEFLTFCQREQLPVDFVSCHPYPTDWALDGHGKIKQNMRGVDSTRADLATTRKIVAAGPYPNAEIHLTEWNSSPSPRDYAHDYLPAATFAVKANLESAGLVDSLSYWTFTDVFEEGGGGASVFHGGFGMINFQGIAKPAFHAYRMLNLLGDELLVAEKGGAVTRSRVDGKLSALFYHYPPEVKTAAPSSFKTRDIADATMKIGSPGKIKLTLTGLRPRAPVEVQTLGAATGDAMTAWQEMGMPEPPTREQTAILKARAEGVRRELFRANAAGNFALEREIAPWNVVLAREI